MADGRTIIVRVSATPGPRTCPHCHAPIAADLSKKCASCKKALPEYCFACYAPLANADVPTCPSCGRARWVFGDHTDLACAVERGHPERQHRWMATVVKNGAVLHEWRCLKCLTDETRTDAFSHFPVPAAATS